MNENNKSVEVIFSHGKESGPRGSKILRLSLIAESFGCRVSSIDYTDTMDPDVRADRLKIILKEKNNDFILIGSSMGSYVSLVAAGEFNPVGLFLLAPAIYIFGFQKQSYPTNCKNIEIVHGWNDEVIPYELSIRYARETKSTLHLIDGDHRLNSSIKIIEGLFKNFLGRVLINE